MSVLSRVTIIAFVVMSFALHAQWTNDSTAHTTTDRSVGINLDAASLTQPAQTLHVFGKGLFQSTGVNAGAAAVIFDRTDGKVAAFGAGGLSTTFAYDSSGIFKIESNSRSVISNGLFGGSVGAVTRLEIDTNGKVTIGLPLQSGETATEKLHVNGIVSGVYVKAHYQDLAEWVPSRNDLAPGTVVVLDAEVGNAVVPSSLAYDTSVAGVVSAQPGIVLGEESTAKEMIATTGRVRVRVDATIAPIRVGDLLVTSNKPGMAMKSEAVQIRGRKFHQPGTILGKALEALDDGEGEILVLLSLQ